MCARPYMSEAAMKVSNNGIKVNDPHISESWTARFTNFNHVLHVGVHGRKWFIKFHVAVIDAH